MLPGKLYLLCLVLVAPGLWLGHEVPRLQAARWAPAAAVGADPAPAQASAPSAEARACGTRVLTQMTLLGPAPALHQASHGPRQAAPRWTRGRAVRLVRSKPLLTRTLRL